MSRACVLGDTSRDTPELMFRTITVVAELLLLCTMFPEPAMVVVALFLLLTCWNELSMILR